MSVTFVFAFRFVVHIWDSTKGCPGEGPSQSNRQINTFTCISSLFRELKNDTFNGVDLIASQEHRLKPCARLQAESFWACNSH